MKKNNKDSTINNKHLNDTKKLYCSGFATISSCTTQMRIHKTNKKTTKTN